MKIPNAVRVSDMPEDPGGRLRELKARLGSAMTRLDERAKEQPLDIQQRVARRETFEAARIMVRKWWPCHVPLLKTQIDAAATLLFEGIQHSIAVITMDESGSGKSMEMKAFTGETDHGTCSPR